MTCIAYRDGVLAADRQLTSNGIMSETDGKVLIIDDNTVMAFSGIFCIAEHFKQWYKSGAIREDWSFSTEVPDRCAMIVLVMHITDDAKVELTYWDDLVLSMTLDPKKYHAHGTGRELALGAMCVGANAVDAIFAANNHLDDCGFGVCAVDESGPKFIIKRIQR